MSLDANEFLNNLNEADLNAAEFYAELAKAQEEMRKARAEKKATPSQDAAPAAPEAAPWPELPKEALYGLPGDICRALYEVTEADMSALLVHVLTLFGALVGRNPYYEVSGALHYPNLYAVIVGRSSVARKTSAWQIVRTVFKRTDPNFFNDRILGGVGSGEGVIAACRDEVVKPAGKNKAGRILNEEDIVVDPGEIDKRLLILETEFAQVLRVLQREGSILSVVLRQGWDDGFLRTTNKNSPLKASHAHICMIGHISVTELKALLSDCEASNGFGNRILWTLARRSKLLPDPEKLPEKIADDLFRRFCDAHRFAVGVGEMKRDEQAVEAWRAVYPDLTRERFGLFGALTSRAEAQTLRLSMIYALMDKSPVIRLEHLLAGLALWQYCEASVKWLFTDALGDKVADRIIAALRATENGLTLSDIHALFQRHETGSRIRAALRLLEEAGLATMRIEQGDGIKPVERWFALGGKRA
jgi:hypothetical protein